MKKGAERDSYNTTTTSSVPDGARVTYTCNACGETTFHQSYRTYYHYWHVTYYAERWKKRGWVTLSQINTWLDTWKGGVTGGASPCNCELASNSGSNSGGG